MKTAVVVLADGFEEIEAVTPVDLLRRAGVRVTIAGLSGTTATSSRGLVIGCDASLEGLAPGWDALVLPGGLPGASLLAESPLVSTMLDDSFSRGAWVAAICAAPGRVLGASGRLVGRRFTGYPGSQGDGFGGRYVEEPVVVDGNVITSRGVGTAGAFALKLVEVLAGREKSAEVAEATLLNGR